MSLQSQDLQDGECHTVSSKLSLSSRSVFSCLIDIAPKAILYQRKKTLLLLLVAQTILGFLANPLTEGENAGSAQQATEPQSQALLHRRVLPHPNNPN